MVNMKIDIDRKDATILLYALQLLLDKQQEAGYSDSEIEAVRNVSESVFYAALQTE